MKTCNMCRHFSVGQSDWVWCEDFNQSLELEFMECKLKGREICEPQSWDDPDYNPEAFLAFAESCDSFEVPTTNPT